MKKFDSKSFGSNLDIFIGNDDDCVDSIGNCNSVQMDSNCDISNNNSKSLSNTTLKNINEKLNNEDLDENNNLEESSSKNKDQVQLDNLLKVS